MSAPDQHETPPAVSSARTGETFRGALRRRWKLIVAAVILVPLVVGVISALQEKQYSASSTLLFRSTNFAEQLFGTSYLPASKDPAREAATNANLVSLDAVAVRTARKLGGGVTGSEVADKVEAAPEGASDLVTVTARDPDPRRAAEIARVFADQFVQFRRQADQAVINRAQSLVADRLVTMSPRQRAGSQGRTLQQRADQLQILASLQTGNAEVVEQATVPGSPSSPRVARNIALAIVLGAALGLGLALLADRLDQGLRSVEEIEDVFPSPVLAQIPRRPGLRSAGAAQDRALHPEAADLDPFRLLRTRLRYFNVDRTVRTILVTSADPGAGKTTVSMCLAVALAQAGDRVILLEADLRRPALRERLGVTAPTAGLSELLAGDITLTDAIKAVEVPLGEHAPVTLDLIASGAVPPNPAELLESQRMRDLLAELSDQYDAVIVDSAPPLLVPDTVPLLGTVDGVLAVLRVGSTPRREAAALASQLAGVSSPLLGTIANDVRRSRLYDYSYTY